MKSCFIHRFSCELGLRKVMQSLLWDAAMRVRLPSRWNEAGIKTTGSRNSRTGFKSKSPENIEANHCLSLGLI